MPGANGQPAIGEVLTALGYAMFLRGPDGALLLQGSAPEWLRSLWPSLGETGAALPLDDASPFLENFLFDADEAWQAGGEARARSGPWIETGADGNDVTLEATALTAGGQSILLLERQGEQFEARKAMLQTARETVIAYQRLNSETQKKEVLLSWIAEQMNAALANVITSLRLIELENSNPPRTRQLLALASRAADEQQALINKILGVFQTELEGLYGRGPDASGVADAAAMIRELQEDFGARFAEHGTKLTPPRDAPHELRVAIEVGQLKRVLTSLLEISLENTVRSGEVTLEVRDADDSFFLRICDDGAPLPPDVCEGLFSKTSSTSAEAEAFSVRLQFCRVAMENCGGEIGCEAREPRGNCFWIRLPKAGAAA